MLTCFLSFDGGDVEGDAAVLAAVALVASELLYRIVCFVDIDDFLANTPLGLFPFAV
jgi:hypothetical protein